MLPLDQPARPCPERLGKSFKVRRKVSDGLLWGGNFLYGDVLLFSGNHSSFWRLKMDCMLQNNIVIRS